MKQYSWLKHLELYSEKWDKGFIPFHFLHTITKTNKAVLLKIPPMKDQPNAIWVPYWTMKLELEDKQPKQVWINQEFLLSRLEKATLNF